MRRELRVQQEPVVKQVRLEPPGALELQESRAVLVLKASLDLKDSRVLLDRVESRASEAQREQLAHRDLKEILEQLAKVDQLDRLDRLDNQDCEETLDHLDRSDRQEVRDSRELLEQMADREQLETQVLPGALAALDHLELLDGLVLRVRLETRARKEIPDLLVPVDRGVVRDNQVQ